jgi:hypothetical protein
MSGLISVGEKGVKNTVSALAAEVQKELYAKISLS